MIDPHLIFQTPEDYLDYMVGVNPEGQYFDRKEIRNDSKTKMEEGRESLIECVSAFTNSRGGITIVGIGNKGELLGLNHLSENDYNSLTKIVFEKINNHQSMDKEWETEGKKLLLIYSPQGRTGICKTVKRESPKGWIRSSANNLPLTQEMETRLLVERNSNFEQLSLTEFDISLINKDVLSIFKKRYLEETGASYSYDDKDFLKTIVAIKLENNKLVITNAGLLFLATIPQDLFHKRMLGF